MFGTILKLFTKDRRGNVAMMYALMLVPVLFGVGAAIDFTRANQVRSNFAEGADAGLLAAARSAILDDTLTEEQINTLARRFFDGNTISSDDFIVDTFDLVADRENQVFTLNITGRVRTQILGIGGRDFLPININSEAQISPPRLLELALVLDNTFSMTGARLDALKDASEDLVNIVMDDTGDDNVKIGIVPFSQYVNIGLSRRDEPWLDGAEDVFESSTENVCRNTFPNSNRTCVDEYVPCTETIDGIEVSSTCRNRTCTGDRGQSVQSCEIEDVVTEETWHGCVGSRNYPFNVRDEKYDVRLVPALLDIECTRPLTALTSNKQTVLDEIEALAVQGDQTYIPGGLVWGYRMMTNLAPLDEATTFTELQSQQGVKSLILMTDGVNTRSAAFPLHTNAGGFDADRVVEELCEEIKGDGIELYTIAFEVTDSTVEELLLDCASAPENFFDATDAASLADAFETIGNGLVELALTR